MIRHDAIKLHSVIVRGTPAILLGLLCSAAPPTGFAQAPKLEPYVMVDQWPDKTQSTAGVIQDPKGLDVSLDGRVYISDAGVGGVLTLLPSGDFLPPFGATGSQEERLGAPGRLSVDQDNERVYVLDTASDRVVAYDLDGMYVTSWGGVAGVAISAVDGRVFVADAERNQVRAFDAAGGEIFAFGELGTGDGQFTILADVSVSPDGEVLAVGDMNELRVQLFDLGPNSARLRRVYMLNHPRYNQAQRHPRLPSYLKCRAGIVHALGSDDVWVGDGTGACRITPEGFTYGITASAVKRSICKQTVVLPRIRPATDQYYALATHDPNVGSCRENPERPGSGKDTRLPTTPAVLEYADTNLRRVRALWLASDELGDIGLLAPRTISVPAPGIVFAQDSSPFSRFFAPDGTPLGTSVLRGLWGRGRTSRFYVEIAVGTATPGEIVGYYRQENLTKLCNTVWTAWWLETEHGVGRFRTVQHREGNEVVDVLEPIWRTAFGTVSPERATKCGLHTNTLAVTDVAFNHASDEVLVLVGNRSPGRANPPSPGTETIRIERFRADGVTSRLADWVLPNDETADLQLNPYTGLGVGPDGRVYVLNDLDDAVRIMEADGRLVAIESVPPDARRVAGGPAGQFFVLREPGYVERLRAGDGAVTARFDGRPFPNADPSTLSDLAVDDEGRVFVADGLSSVVSVFLPAGGDSDALPVPSDASCVLTGDKTASPRRLPLGDSTSVSLAVSGQCGVGEEPADIMLVVHYFPPKFDPVEGIDAPIEPLIRELTQLLSQIDLRVHRVGILSYWTDMTLEIALTHDRAALLKAVQTVTRRWPPCCPVNSCNRVCPSYRQRQSLRLGGGICCTSVPRVGKAMGEAQKQFDPSIGRRRVMLLYQPDYCNREFEYFDGQCRNYKPDAEEVAEAVRDTGTEVVVFDGNRTGYREFRFTGWPYQGDARPLASSDADVVLTAREAHHRTVDYRVPGALATDFTLVDELPANMEFAGSMSPPGSATDLIVRWSLPSLPHGQSTFSFDLEPKLTGRWPTNVRAIAEYVDGWGQPGQIVFPVPEVEVNVPTPTPPEPTPTPEPTRAPQPSRIFLPVTMRGHSVPAKQDVTRY